MQGKIAGITFNYKLNGHVVGRIWCPFFDFMRYKLASRKSASALVLILASLLPPSLQAEPVINGPAQPANHLIDASQWVPDAQDQLTKAPAPQTGAISTTSMEPSRRQPLVEASSGTPALLGSPPDKPAAATRAAPAKTVNSTGTEAPLGREIRDSVKEAVRPLYQDLVTSDAAQALRGLQSNLSSDKDHPFNDTETTPQTRLSGSGVPSEATAWDGQSSREPPRSAAQVERDKILASVMMDKLIDEVTPWALGLLALYVLSYLVKLALAYGRLRSNRRRQRTVRRRHTKTSA